MRGDLLKEAPAAATLPMADSDAWYCVAQYIPAHPQTFTLLAQVNKAAHAAFMSDLVWEKLDFYDIRERIAEHYLVESATFSSQQRLALRHPDFGKISPVLQQCSPSCRLHHLQKKCYVCRDFAKTPCRFHHGLCIQCNHCTALDECWNTANLYVSFMMLASRPAAIQTLGSTCRRIPDNFKIRRLLTRDHSLLQYIRSADLPELTKIQLSLSRHFIMSEVRPERLYYDAELLCAAMEVVPQAWKFAGPEILRDARVYFAILQVLRKESRP